jgi:hypothetical protein
MTQASPNVPDDVIWVTNNYGLPAGSVWTENDKYVLMWCKDRFVIGELKTLPIARQIMAALDQVANYITQLPSHNHGRRGNECPARLPAATSADAVLRAVTPLQLPQAPG